MKYSYRFFENRDCEYFPCHKGVEELNCLFCYCPLYQYDNCPGSPSYMEKDGRKIKICSDCTFPHQPDQYDRIMQILKAGRPFLLGDSLPCDVIHEAVRKSWIDGQMRLDFG